jgi:hypothetical protein
MHGEMLWFNEDNHEGAIRAEDGVRLVVSGNAFVNGERPDAVQVAPSCSKSRARTAGGGSSHYRRPLAAACPATPRRVNVPPPRRDPDGHGCESLFLAPAAARLAARRSFSVFSGCFF